jgi:hypothetical protein
MLLLLRWSGLRISDAAKLERSKLTDDGKLFLYTQKTGQPVYRRSFVSCPTLRTRSRDYPTPTHTSCVIRLRWKCLSPV